MKVCAYCGRHNEDNAIQCSECATEEFKGADQLANQFAGRKWHFGILPPEAMDQDFVTLVTCRTLAEADVVVSDLEGAGISAFIPDESLMQVFPCNLMFGFVRVQVAPKDYLSAREFLNAEVVSGPPPISN
jgi:hypothetical protein